jgi:phospholipase/carboxylesterase
MSLEPIGGLECLVTGSGPSLVVGLHGRGSTPELFLEHTSRVGEASHRVLPRAMRPYENGFGWYELGPPRDTQLAEAITRVLALLVELRSKYQIGPERTALWGFSQGGLLALEVGLRTPSPLAAVACVGGKLDPATFGKPELLRRGRQREILLVHGVLDTVVPVEEGRKSYTALTAHGAKVRLAELATGHQLHPLVSVAVGGFFAERLGP